MKLKDFLLKLKEQGKITSEEFDKMTDKIPDFDLPEDFATSVEGNFLTRERALSDPTVYGKVKAEVYNGIDAQITQLLPGLPKFDQVAIEGEKDTHKRIKMLDAAYKKQFDELKTNAPDAAKIKEEYKKTIDSLTQRVEEANQQIEKAKSEQENKIKEITESSAKEIKSYKLRTDITGRLSKMELANEFTSHPVVKDSIYKSIIDNLMQNELDYDEQGQIIVQEISNGVAKPKFFPGSNDVVTLEKLIETQTAPYIKRSEGGGNNTQKPVPPVTIPKQPENGQTLQQRRAAAAAYD